MPNTYDVGDLVRVTGTFTDSDGSAVDPTALKIYYKAPGGTITEKLYGTDTDVIKDSTGVYHLDIDINASGRWFYRFVGTGSAQAADEYWFNIERLNIST